MYDVPVSCPIPPSRTPGIAGIVAAKPIKWRAFHRGCYRVVTSPRAMGRMGQEHGPPVRDAKHHRVSSRQRSYWQMFLLLLSFAVVAQAARHWGSRLLFGPFALFCFSCRIKLFRLPIASIPSHLPFPPYLHCSVSRSLCCCARACRQLFPSASSDVLIPSTHPLTSLLLKPST